MLLFNLAAEVGCYGARVIAIAPSIIETPLSGWTAIDGPPAVLTQVGGPRVTSPRRSLSRIERGYNLFGRLRW
jgi:NAD(P)-dependent dehydrogenase (short-subunit alcohol dehydrogenase family)